MAELKVVGDPQAAERLCDDEDDSDSVSPSVGVGEPSTCQTPDCVCVPQASGDFGSGDGGVVRQTGSTPKVSFHAFCFDLVAVCVHASKAGSVWNELSFQTTPASFQPVPAPPVTTSERATGNRRQQEMEGGSSESPRSCCRSTFIQKYVAQSCLDLTAREGFDCRGSTRFRGFGFVLRPLVERLSRAESHT